MQIANRFIYILLSIAYGIFLYFIYRRTGIVVINEAEKYIHAADALLKGNLAASIQQYPFYSSYICFVALFKLIGGIKLVVIAQAVLSFFSAICIKKIIDLICDKSNFSILGMLIFLFSYPLQYWTLTLFSDSFFVSLIAITLFYTVKEKSKKELFLWTLFNFVLIAARPPGIFLSILFVLYFLAKEKKITEKKVIIQGIILYFILLISLFYWPAETKTYITPIAGGAVIVDETEYDIPAFDLKAKSTMTAAYKYLYSHHGPIYIVTLYCKKVLSFFTLTRPYYSNLNNLILSFHYLLYLFSIAGIYYLRKKKNPLMTALFLLPIFLIANLVGLTYNEWHYRFTLAIFPFLIILAILGILLLYRFLTDFRTTKPIS
jgi:hypothetical protein